MASRAGDLTSLVETLDKSDEDSEVLICLVELCQLLAMASEDSMSSFPSKQAVSCLTRLIRGDHFTSDIVLYSCRALFYFIDLSPRSLATVVEAVPALLEKLQVVEYIDIAENALQVLELISRKHEEPILKKNGISSCLKFIDFLSEPAQRKALTIVCNCCKMVKNASDFNYVKNSIDVLTGRLLNQDKKSLESVCLCFHRLIENLSHDESCLKQIANEDLFNKLQRLLIITPSVISSTTYNNIINMMNILCCSSFQLKLLLLQSRISETLLYLLVGSKKDASAALHIELVPRSIQETYETVNLISNLLPPLPHSTNASSSTTTATTTTPMTTALQNINSRSSGSKDFLNQLFSINEVVAAVASACELLGCDVSGEGLHHWQYLDEKGVWKNFGTAEDELIEMSYKAGEHELSIGSDGTQSNHQHILHINFATMQRSYNVEKQMTSSVTSSFSKPLIKSSSSSAATPLATTSIRRMFFRTKTQQQQQSSSSSSHHNKKSAGSSSTTATTASSLLPLSSSSSSNNNSDNIISFHHSTLLDDLITMLLPVTYEVFTATASLAVKHRCLNALLRMIHYSTSDLLRTVLISVPISSLIADMLTSSDVTTLVSSIQLSHLLMDKLSDIFDVYFRRQGVVHQMAHLAQTGMQHMLPGGTNVERISTQHHTSSSSAAMVTKETANQQQSKQSSSISKYDSTSSSSASSSSVMYSKGANYVQMNLVSNVTMTSSSSATASSSSRWSTGGHRIDLSQVSRESSSSSYSTTSSSAPNPTSTVQVRISDVIRSNRRPDHQQQPQFNQNQSASSAVIGSFPSNQGGLPYRSSAHHLPPHHHQYQQPQQQQHHHYQSMLSIHDRRPNNASYTYNSIYNYHMQQQQQQQQLISPLPLPSPQNQYQQLPV
ncbi:hypothetical protein HELRODRAFT_190186, partial [Helobdella robusta]|uniref:E3 ubiquitin-protein ligase n=1 Tax=Helobdella robusta TaxID=6412 RepID=T1FRR7_HELRO